jgi:hypothetical protein
LRRPQGYAKSKAMPTTSNPLPTPMQNPADPTRPTSPAPVTSDPQGPKRPLPDAAVRALAEATARRKEREAKSQAAHEVGGRAGLDPTRYGDWEVNGLASDF